MDKRILITMPGDRDNQVRYATVLDELGLSPFCDYCLQVHTTIKDMYPENFPEQATVGEWVADDAIAVKDRYWSPKTYTHAFYDYEEGETKNWMLEKLYEAYNADDVRFVGGIRRGMQKALPNLKRSMYRTPMITNGPFNPPQDIHNLMSLNPELDLMDWIWLGLYPFQHWVNKDMTQPMRDELALRVSSQYSFLAQMLRKPIVASFFLHYHMTTERCTAYHEHAIDSLPPACKQIGIWSDLRSVTDIQIEHLRAIAPKIHEWVEN